MPEKLKIIEVMIGLVKKETLTRMRMGKINISSSEELRW